MAHEVHVRIACGSSQGMFVFTSETSAVTFDADIHVRVCHKKIRSFSLMSHAMI